MLKRDGGKQLKMTFLTLEELMPEKHFLRDLERCVDFSFIYDIVEPLYAKVGRPSVDPVLLVKMLLLGYLYGIPSERKLEQEVRVNIAFRWFLGIDFDEPVPDHSTISQLRRRKFGGTTLFQDIFDEVVRKCMAAGLVSGKLLLTDSTHILANAAKEKREVIEVPDTPSEYVKKLDRDALTAPLAAGGFRVQAGTAQQGTIKFRQGFRRMQAAAGTAGNKIFQGDYLQNKDSPEQQAPGFREIICS